MPCGGDASRPVHIEPDVALIDQEWFPRVQSDPHPHRAVSERELRVLGRRHRIGGTRKRHEEAVPLRVDFDPVVPPPGLSQRAAVLAKHFRVPVAQLPEQPRRTLDVGEQEGHRPGRELSSHPSILARHGPRCHGALVC